MLFKLLKLFGLDVHAEIAAVKGEITRRVDDAADRRGTSRSAPLSSLPLRRLPACCS
jgi:hypothetical protein